jgi:hypothetical protein
MSLAIVAGIFFVTICIMEKRFLGIILAVLGIAGLIFATVNFINGGSGAHHVRQVIGYGVLGLIFFAAGVGLIRTTRDKPS